MNLSIIIVTYNSLDYIKNCIDSIIKSTKDLVYEIIIVDNSSDEISIKTKEYVQNLYGDKIVFLKNKSNLGYGQGNNYGVVNSNYELLCIMNPDIILSDNILLEDAISQFNTDNNLGMLGYKQLGGKNLSFYMRQEYFTPIIDPLIVKILNKINYFNSKYMFMSGALFFMPRDVFEKIGKFDEKIFLYSEESDLTMRLLHNNLRIKFDKSISYIHDIGIRKKDLSINTFKYNINTSVYYLDKYFHNSNSFIQKKKIELLFFKVIDKLLNKNRNQHLYDLKIQYLNQLLK